MPSPLLPICSSSDDALFFSYNASLSLVSIRRVAFKGELLGVACSLQHPMVKANVVQFYSSLYLSCFTNLIISAWWMLGWQ
jgi:hypothetical protein